MDYFDVEGNIVLCIETTRHSSFSVGKCYELGGTFFKKNVPNSLCRVKRDDHGHSNGKSKRFFIPANKLSRILWGMQ